MLQNGYQVPNYVVITIINMMYLCTLYIPATLEHVHLIDTTESSILTKFRFVRGLLCLLSQLAVLHSDSGWGLYRGNSNMTKFQIFQIYWA